MKLMGQILSRPFASKIKICPKSVTNQRLQTEDAGSPECILLYMSEGMGVKLLQTHEVRNVGFSIKVQAMGPEGAWLK